MSSKLILASSSPRRREILNRLNIDFDIYSPDVDETFQVDRSIDENARDIVKRKAYAAREKYSLNPVIAADTFIVFNNKVLGKPRDRGEANKFLNTLNNRTHSVFTYIALLDGNNNIDIEYDETRVVFRDLSQEEIETYLNRKEWLGAAGAYKIQETGEALIKEITGSYTCVMGLPFSKIYGMLNKLNLIIPVF